MEMEYVDARLKKTCAPKIRLSKRIFGRHFRLPSTIFSEVILLVFGGWVGHGVAGPLYSCELGEIACLQGGPEEISVVFWCNKMPGARGFCLTGWTVLEFCSMIFVVFFGVKDFVLVFLLTIFWKNKMQLNQFRYRLHSHRRILKVRSPSGSDR